MSNVLAKDRKEPKLAVMAKGKELAIDIIKLEEDNNKFPIRKQRIIGERMANHAINSYEYLHEANMIYPDSRKKLNKRLDLGLKAKEEANALNADLELLPYIIPSSENTKWYNDLVNQSIRYETMLHKWIKGEHDREVKIYKEAISKKTKSEKSDNIVPIAKKSNIDINDKSIVEKMIL